jgi:hypothetical protein
MSGDDDTDNDSLDALILETIGEKAATQTKPSGATSTISNSSDSTSPCPINCYGCGEISDGNDDQNQVQCSHCGFWSHFKCQPENDELDWSDPAVNFTCQGCRPRTAAQPLVPASAPHLFIYIISQVFVRGNRNATRSSSRRPVAGREGFVVSGPILEAPPACTEQEEGV